ncbi:hypothetical protein CCL42_gp60 [Sulfolobus islandicus rod-shaped virus 8]|uniref:Uncharacterized protein n=2 Tax=Usarudivirus TaxID=2843109 RepID=A0A1X9SJI8_9VIRU|nr:hypothetical protein CCL41_gp56 [Sulfolobus islandicus rod-shaped virus 9]YP_009362733.1 hypothetical protein CCL42_gp60 [Sulfolobus islandicus rod-shaped virus 8]ARQ96404.1 hypothetical protein [Sulfolobus islandicus rod-shaped virus 9]ARQ96466.1 hypothetical protein [Sulfolobus islandicus rod-shaped virus 8]
MIQKYIIGRWEVYICLLCNKKLGERRIDGYLASYHNCEHYYWKVVVGKKAKEIGKTSLIKAKRDGLKYFLLSDID